MFWCGKKEIVRSQMTKEAYIRMEQEIKKVGSSLHFVLKIDNEGWFATCQEFSGIMTGGENKNPTQKEIMESIIDSIKTAFDIPIETVCGEDAKIKTIITESRELELCV